MPDQDRRTMTGYEIAAANRWPPDEADEPADDMDADERWYALNDGWVS